MEYATVFNIYRMMVLMVVVINSINYRCLIRCIQCKNTRENIQARKSNTMAMMMFSTDTYTSDDVQYIDIRMTTSNEFDQIENVLEHSTAIP